MSYTPHTWTSGEVVTASKMNALEQGVGNATQQPLVCVPDGDGILNVTFGTLYERFMSGSPVYLKADANPNDSQLGIFGYLISLVLGLNNGNYEGQVVFSNATVYTGLHATKSAIMAAYPFFD